MADSSTPIQQIVAGAAAATNLNENFDAASPVMMFGRDARTTAGLAWGYVGGRYEGTVVANGTVTLTDNTVNYEVMHRGTRAVTVSASTTNWNDVTTYGRLYRITTSGGIVISYEDHRFGDSGIIGRSSYGFDLAATTHAATGKSTPVDADELPLVDSAASYALKKLTWANLKATLNAYTDTLYALVGAITGSGLTMATGKLLGRSTAGTGGVEEITVGTGLSLSGGTLTATSGGGVELRGITFTSDTSSTADSDPGNGLFKWNNATQASATTLFVDNQTADAVTATTFFAKLDPGGYFYIQQTDDTTRWQQWRITGLPVAASGYYKFPVTLMAKGADIQTGKVCACLLTPGVCETWAFACSDYKTTALTATTDVGGMFSPYAATVFDVSAGLAVAQTSGSVLTVDVNEAGTTILSTKLTFDNTENSTTTAATPPVISDSSIAAGAKLNADVDQIGDGTAKGLTVYLRVFRT